MLILGSVFAAVPQRGAAEYFQSDSDIFEGLWGGLGGGRGNPGQLYTHTLHHQLTVSTLKGMCLTLIDALSVMQKTVGIQIRENDPWERNERWAGEMQRAREKWGRREKMVSVNVW